MENRVKSVALACALVATSMATRAQADVKLPAIISDNMLLQQGVDAPIWGTAKAGEKVTVFFAGQRKTTQADKDNKWLIRLDALDAKTQGEMTVEGENKLTIKNVLVGEVWLASGQSNMAMQVQQADNAKTEIESANFPKIRLFTVAQKVAAQPQTEVSGQWVECSPQTVKSFSAAAFFFGRELHQTLNVPVGLINSSVGGTWIQAWISREPQSSNADFKKALTWWDETFAKAPVDYPAAKQRYDGDLAAWQIEADKAKAADLPSPAKPVAPQNPEAPNRHTGLFNGMISPLMPYGIKGVLWYQGEANAFKNPRYDEWLQLLINDWRTRWGEGNFPFLFVQLPNFKQFPNFVDIRDAQFKTLKLPNTAMAVTIDSGNPDDIHPRNKQVVGHRLVLAALGTVYSHQIEYSGPLYQSVKIEGNKAIVNFTHTGSGLQMKGEALSGFSIAGADKNFVPAQARIEGSSVVVWSEQITSPVAVRYAWEANPQASLFNKEMLPASPFRTDDWPLT